MRALLLPFLHSLNNDLIPGLPLGGSVKNLVIITVYKHLLVLFCPSMGPVTLSERETIQIDAVRSRAIHVAVICIVKF